MRAYSNELRVRVIDAIKAGATIKAVAARFVVSKSWVYKILDRYKTTGKYEALKSEASGIKVGKTLSTK